MDRHRYTPERKDKIRYAMREWRARQKILENKIGASEHIGTDGRVYGVNYKKLLDRSGIKPPKEFE